MPSTAMPSAIGWKAGRVGLEAVGEGVHAGAGGDRRRQADGQLGVEDHLRRHHPRMEDDLLGAGREVGDDPGAADLGAGAGGGRHRDHGAMPAGSARVHQSPTSSKSQIGRVWPRMKATTLPTSSAEPPPKATTPSWPPSRRAARPRSTFASVGLGWTSEKTPGAAGRRRASDAERARGDRQVHEAGVGDQQRAGDAGDARRRRRVRRCGRRRSGSRWDSSSWRRAACQSFRRW